MHSGCIALAAIAFALALPSQTVAEDCALSPTGNGAVFFHPDGTLAGHRDAMRLVYCGPVGNSNWDRMPRMAAYRGHLTDQLSGTSSAGASIHATGTPTWSGSFGQDESGAKLRAADGLERIAANPRGFFAVIEEEGSDNFCNQHNASGCLEALKRADDAIGRMLGFIERHPKTFVLMASDSNAGGMQINEVDDPDASVPERDARSGAMLDGRDGTATLPFLSASDRNGKRFPFAIAWAVGDDVGSGVIARAAGHNADGLLPGNTLVKTDVYRALYFQLFGKAIQPLPVPR